jgi:hypothetical protein
MSVATHPPVTSHDNSLGGARAWFAEKGLSRPRKGRLTELMSFFRLCNT